MEERNLMLEIENIINCGRKKEEPYFSLRDKFRERIFTEPVMPAQMIFYWTLPETFEPEDLEKEFSLGYKSFAADVYNESINSIIEKMKEYSKKMNRLFVCPCTDDETRKKILDALHIIFPKQKKDVDILYKKDSATKKIPDYLKKAKSGDYLTTKLGNIILVHHVDIDDKDFVSIYPYFDYCKKEDKISMNEFLDGYYGPNAAYEFFRPSTDSEIKFFKDKLKEYGYEQQIIERK